jgi:hypothetical protein
MSTFFFAARIARELWWMNQEFSPVSIIPPWFSAHIYHLGVNNKPVGGCSSEMYSHTIDMIIIKVGRLEPWLDIAPCSLIVVDKRFRGAYCFHHQDDE